MPQKIETFFLFFAGVGKLIRVVVHPDTDTLGFELYLVFIENRIVVNICFARFFMVFVEFISFDPPISGFLRFLRSAVLGKSKV